MNETSKLNEYRLSHGYDNYLKGEVIDIGCGDDPLSKEVFKNITSVRPYDLDLVDAPSKGGDAQFCANLKDNSFDTVYSSHCLEHTVDPRTALSNWIRICKPQGYIVVAIPDAIFYEKLQFPSLYNSDHRWCFSLEKPPVPKCINVYELLGLYNNIEVVSVELLLKMDFTKFMEDATLGDGVCQIEMVLKKV